jgi:hypothetical protein
LIYKLIKKELLIYTTMERHPLEQLGIPLDIWREIKTYIVHNIKTQGKHLKKEKSVINFNKSLQDLPTFKPPTTGPQIVFTSAMKPLRMARYLYHIQAFKPVNDAAEPYRDGKISLSVTCLVKFTREWEENNTLSGGADCLYHRLDYQNHWSGTNNTHDVAIALSFI